MKRLWWFLYLMSSLVTADAQQAPTAPPTNASSQTNGVPMVWPPNSTVTVYINSNVFPQGSAMGNSIEIGFNADSNAFSPSDGVTYTYVYASTEPTHSQNMLWVTDGPLKVPDATDNTGMFEKADWDAPTFNSAYGVNLTTSGR